VFVDAGIQHAMRVRHIAIRSLSGSIYFSTLSHTWHDFRKKKVTEYKICFDFPYTTFVWNISRSKRTCARYD